LCTSTILVFHRNIKMKARKLAADLEYTRTYYPDTTYLNNNLKSEWVVRLPPFQGLYAGYTLELVIEFPENYPFGCPNLYFLQPVFYPSIQHWGSQYHIYSTIYKSQWRAAMTPKDCNLQSVTDIVIRMLENPQPGSDAFELQQNREAYRRRVVEVMGPPS